MPQVEVAKPSSFMEQRTFSGDPDEEAVLPAGPAPCTCHWEQLLLPHTPVPPAGLHPLTCCSPWLPRRQEGTRRPGSRCIAGWHKHSQVEKPSAPGPPAAPGSPRDCPPAPGKGDREREVGALQRQLRGWQQEGLGVTEHGWGLLSSQTPWPPLCVLWLGPHQPIFTLLMSGPAFSLQTCYQQSPSPPNSPLRP